MSKLNLVSDDVERMDEKEQVVANTTIHSETIVQTDTTVVTRRISLSTGEKYYVNKLN